MASSSNKISINLIIAVAIAIAAIAVTLQNSQVVTLRLLAWQIETSLILLLALNFFAGALLIYVLMFIQQQRLKREKRNLEKEIQKKEAALKAQTPPIS